MTRILPLAALMLLGATPAATPVTGYASAYAPGVFEDVVRYRLDNDIWRADLPHDWYTAHGYIASMDCSQVGQMKTLSVGGRDYRVLVADCAGADGPIDRFSRNSIVAELDWGLWQRLTAEHGTPLGVTIR